MPRLQRWRALSKARNEAELTPAELGDIAGLEPLLIFHLEQGLERPNAKIVKKLSKALRINIKTLTGNIEYRKSPTTLKRNGPKNS